MCDKRFDRLARAHAIGRCSHKGGIPISLRAFCYRSLFDETCKIYLEQNPGMEIVEAERKTFDELKSNYRQALISNYHDLVQLGNILRKDQIHKQIVATTKRLRSEDDYDLAESYAWALKKRKFLLERILDNYEMPKYSTTEELPRTSNAK